MRIEDNWIHFELEELPRDITLQGVADLVAPHFGGDNAMHHYMIRGADDNLVLYYSPMNTIEDGLKIPFSCLNGWGEGDELLFEPDEGERWSDDEPHLTAHEIPVSVVNSGRSGSMKINPWKLLNELRLERGLPKARKPGSTVKVSRDEIQKICFQVWKDKYPRALTDADFVLGELTVKLVEQEVERRIAILRGKLIPLKGQRRSP